MRYLILSDIHANWEALEAVLADAQGCYERVVCCGDIVGYGADPNAAADWVRANAPVCIRGNHDKAATGTDDLEWFNPAAREATLWTQSVLRPDTRDWLAGLPQGPVGADGFLVAHGSPLDEDDYIVTADHAARLFGYIPAPVSFFGHTHLQGGFRIRTVGAMPIEPPDPWESERIVYLSVDCANLVNPGSVGQPRDGDPRAAYALYDTDRMAVQLRRTAYDIAAAQRKILAAGLPELLAFRLSIGS